MSYKIKYTLTKKRLCKESYLKYFYLIIYFIFKTWLTHLKKISFDKGVKEEMVFGLARNPYITKYYIK